MIKKYTIIPSEVEAVEYIGTNLKEIENFLKDDVETVVVGKDDILIKTIAGVIKIVKGDFLIKNSKGEFYHCDKKEFKRMFKELK